MEGLLHGFSVVLSPEHLLFCLIGCFIGTVIGVLPGIGPVGSMALLLSLTFKMDTVSAIIMFAGIYYGSTYGGSTTSILLNIPGEANSVVTCIDGHQMALKGRGGPALFIAAVGSFIAGTIGLILLTFLAPRLATFALKFGPPEYFAVALFGLLVLSRIGSYGFWKSFLVVGLGCLIGTVGIDLVTGQPRGTFGILDLYDGIDFIPLAMGFFGVAEVIAVAEENMKEKLDLIKVRLKELLPNREEARRSVWPCLRGGLGFFISLIPGPSAVISTFVSYAIEQKLSKHPEEFGKGAVEGVAGPESANNAAGIGQFVPLLSLGIPFSASSAMIMTALLIHGVTPGPMLVNNNPDLFWGVIASMYVGNIILVILNLPLVGIFINILRIPKNLLCAFILVLCVIGAYGVTSSVFDIGLLMFAGVLGYIFKKMKFPVAPLILALVISPMMERAFRQSLMISAGSFTIFFTRPISCTLICITIAVFLVPAIMKLVKKFSQKGQPTPGN